MTELNFDAFYLGFKSLERIESSLYFFIRSKAQSSKEDIKTAVEMLDITKSLKEAFTMLPYEANGIMLELWNQTSESKNPNNQTITLGHDQFFVGNTAAIPVFHHIQTLYDNAKKYGKSENPNKKISLYYVDNGDTLKFYIKDYNTDSAAIAALEQKFNADIPPKLSWQDLLKLDPEKNWKLGTLGLRREAGEFGGEIKIKLFKDSEGSAYKVITYSVAKNNLTKTLRPDNKPNLRAILYNLHTIKNLSGWLSKLNKKLNAFVPFEDLKTLSSSLRSIFPKESLKKPAPSRSLSNSWSNFTWHNMILLDDDEIVREAFNSILTKIGDDYPTFSCLTPIRSVELGSHNFANGETLLQAFDKGSIKNQTSTLIFLDYNLEGEKCGDAVAQELRKKGFKGMLIAASDYSDRSLYSSAISKPYCYEELIEIIKPFIDRVRKNISNLSKDSLNASFFAIKDNLSLSAVDEGIGFKVIQARLTRYRSPCFNNPLKGDDNSVAEFSSKNAELSNTPQKRLNFYQHFNPITRMTLFQVQKKPNFDIENSPISPPSMID